MKSKKNVKGGQSTPSDHHCLKSKDEIAKKNSSNLARRSSLRIQKMQKSLSPGSEHPGLVDSAYDADEESVTPGSSPSQQVVQSKDPYEMDMIDDEPIAKTKPGKKIGPKKKNKGFVTKTLKKAKKSPSSEVKPIPTSTPVMQSSGSMATKSQADRTGHSLSVTPEVTPILPYKPHDSTSPTDSFATPQIRRPTRKRSLLPESFNSLSSQLFNSSQGDSGIALSPVSKKRRSTPDTQKQISELDPKTSKHQKKSSLSTKVKNVLNCNMYKKNIFHPISNVPELQKMKKKQPKEYSCFGFESLESPAIASENLPPAKPKRSKRGKMTKKNLPSKDSYRVTQVSSSDSSPAGVTNDPVVSVESESSQENTPRTNTASPTLFSDSFSADSESLEMEVNKSSNRSYSKPSYSKHSKVQREKRTAAVSKLDVWANDFNMEIEKIEKFDLNIE